MTSSAPLFDAALLPDSVKAELPQGYTIRPLEKTDYHTGFLDTLRVLTTVGEISEEKWNERYDWMQRHEGEYYIICIEDSNREEGKRIVGTGALLVERKL